MAEITFEMLAQSQREAFNMGMVQGAAAAKADFEVRITELAGTTDYIRQYIVKLEATVQSLIMELADGYDQIIGLGGRPLGPRPVHVVGSGLVIPTVDPEVAGPTDRPIVSYLLPGDPGFGTEHIDGKLIGGNDEDQVDI